MYYAQKFTDIADESLPALLYQLEKRAECVIGLPICRYFSATFQGDMMADPENGFRDPISRIWIRDHERS